MTATDPVRVLVVDDHRDEGESLAALIELSGYVVDIAGGAEAALEKHFDGFLDKPIDVERLARLLPPL